MEFSTLKSFKVNWLPSATFECHLNTSYAKLISEGFNIFHKRVVLKGTWRINGE